jgi:hypothetical protein
MSSRTWQGRDTFVIHWGDFGSARKSRVACGLGCPQRSQALPFVTNTRDITQTTRTSPLARSRLEEMLVAVTAATSWCETTLQGRGIRAETGLGPFAEHLACLARSALPCDSGRVALESRPLAEQTGERTNQVTCSALLGRDRHHTTSIEPPPRLLTSGKTRPPVVRRAG